MFKTMGGRSLFAGQSFDVIEAPTAGPLVAEALGGVGHHDLVAQVIQTIHPGNTSAEEAGRDELGQQGKFGYGSKKRW